MPPQFQRATIAPTLAMRITQIQCSMGQTRNVRRKLTKLMKYNSLISLKFKLTMSSRFCITLEKGRMKKMKMMKTMKTMRKKKLSQEDLLDCKEKHSTQQLQ